MHRRLTVLCLLVVLLMTSGAALAVEFKTKPKLAFYPLVAKSVEGIPQTEAISTQLFNYIERTDYFEILERRKVETVLLQDAATVSTLSQDALYSVASRAGFDFFIVGSVGRAENASVMELKVVGSGSRNSYYSESFRIPDFEIPKKLQEITEKIVTKVKGFNVGPPPVEKKIVAPANLSITGTPKSIKLKWSPSESPNAVGYAVMRANTPDGTFLQIATTTKPNFTDQNLKLNETFYYKVKAISSNGIDCDSSEAMVGKTSPAPYSPIFMEIKADLAGAQLNWYSRPYSGSDRNLITNGFQIYRKAADEAEFRAVTKVGADATSYTDTDMRNGVLYSYAITSYNVDSVESEFSSTLDAKTPPPITNLKAVAGNRKVQLTWVPNDSKNVQGYAVYRSKGADKEYQRVGQTKGRGSDSYADEGLEDGVTYWYRIAAVLDSAETPKSDAVSAATRQRPSPPAALSATSNEPRRVTLSWKNGGTPEEDLKGYNLYRSREKEGEFVKIAEIAAKKNSHLDDRESAGGSRLGSLVGEARPLADGTTYYYRLTSFNGAGSESLPGETVSATTRPALAPPKGLKASNGQAGKVNLNWEAGPDFKEYEIYRGPAGQSEVQRIKKVKEPFYVDSSVDDGASYIYAIKGIDAYEIESIISTSVGGATKPRPVMPKNVQVAEQNGRKLLRWEANPEKGVLRYNVYKKNFVGMFQKLQTVGGTNFALDELKGYVELKLSALDEDGLESDKTDVLKLDLK